MYMYGGLDMSANSLHRDFTDSLISGEHINEKHLIVRNPCAASLYTEV